jgi:hypothetical protein
VGSSSCLQNLHAVVLSESVSQAGMLQPTSLMLVVSVKSIVMRSMPMPQPPVGGKPYSSAVQNVSSMNMASSSPAAW